MENGWDKKEIVFGNQAIVMLKKQQIIKVFVLKMVILILVHIPTNVIVLKKATSMEQIKILIKSIRESKKKEMKKIVIYLFNCFILMSCNMNNSKYAPEKYFATGDEFRLADAIYYDNESEVKSVINETNIDINKPGKYGLTYLMYAIYCKQYSMVKLLLKLGADPNILSEVYHPIRYDNQDVTLRDEYPELRMPLPFVCGNPDWDMKYIKLLVENGADVNLANPFLPLNEVLVGGNANMKKIKYLMEHGADLNSFDSRGVTPIIKAAMMRELDLIEIFWEHGANPKHINNYGGSVAYWLEEDINKNLGTPEYIAHAKRIIERLKAIGVKFPVEHIPPSSIVPMEVEKPKDENVNEKS